MSLFSTPTDTAEPCPEYSSAQLGQHVEAKSPEQTGLLLKTCAQEIRRVLGADLPFSSDLVVISQVD